MEEKKEKKKFLESIKINKTLVVVFVSVILLLAVIGVSYNAGIKAQKHTPGPEACVKALDYIARNLETSKDSTAAAIKAQDSSPVDLKDITKFSNECRGAVNGSKGITVVPIETTSTTVAK